MVVLLVMTGCMLFHILMVLGTKDVLNTCVRAYVKVMIVARATLYSLKEIFIFVTIQIGEYILNNDVQKNT